MKSKIVIFLIIGTSLVAAIYSASTYFIFAVIVGDSICFPATNAPSYMYCTNPKKQTISECVKDKKGNWACHVLREAPNVTPGLTDALDAAIQESQNTTKVPKSGLLNEGGILKSQGDNQTTSQRIVNPEDRFCVQGTGGQTGTPCVSCNPGKVNCIDVVTGGLLDTPDAATSEEDDDTNPKDLGGLNDNNDENGPEVNPGE